MTTRDDIARAAREAGWSGLYTQWAEPTGRPDWKPVKESLTVPVTAEQVERFFRAAYDAGATAERNACLAEFTFGRTTAEIKNAIRARGNK